MTDAVCETAVNNDPLSVVIKKDHWGKWTAETVYQISGAGETIDRRLEVTTSKGGAANGYETICRCFTFADGIRSYRMALSSQGKGDFRRTLAQDAGRATEKNIRQQHAQCTAPESMKAILELARAHYGG